MDKSYIKGGIIGAVIFFLLPLFLGNLAIVLVSLGEGVFVFSLWVEFFVKVFIAYVSAWVSVAYIVAGFIFGAFVSFVHRKFKNKKEV